MKILHTIATLSSHSGGTSTSTYELVKALNEKRLNCDVLTSHTETMLGDDDFIKVFKLDYKTPFSYSPNMRKKLQSMEGYNLFHINGMWLDINYYSGVIAGKKGVKYLISPHGMLYPQALSIKPFSKKIMRKLFFDKLLANASCIHATCHEELKHYRNLGFTNPVAVIPNMLKLPAEINPIICDRQTKRFGFIGRFHPIKNIPALIEAWSMLGDKTQEAELLLIGSGADGYEQKLKKQASLCPYNNIKFCGFVSGEEKFKLLGSLTALCLPSLQENFGMTVLEALAMKTPVIAAKSTPWEDLEVYECGWWIDNAPKELAETIQKVLDTSNLELQKKGSNGLRCLQEKYSENTVTQQMTELYHWLTYGGVPPSFVEKL